MGFSTGFTGGVTLTLSLAYLSVVAHQQNRRMQAEALRSQVQVLNGLFESTLPPTPQSRAEMSREEHCTLTERFKDRWNEEIENAVRWVQKKNWDEVREDLEGTLSRLLFKNSSDFNKSANEISAGIQSATTNITGADSAMAIEARDVAIPRAKNISENANAARRVLEDAVNLGFEKGADITGSVQASVGFSTEKMESRRQLTAERQSSDIEKALQERYKKPVVPSKSVEEALEERYKPIDARDNTVLRGV